MSNDLVLYERWRLEGDAEAFQALAGRYAGMVYATCRRVLADATEAEDVAQECFEQLARTKAPPCTNVAAWLHRTARNRAISRLRADKSRHERELAYAASRAQSDQLAWGDLAHFVDDVIDALPDKFRDPVIAHFLNGDTHQVIATRYGVTRASITYRVGKGIEGVRKHLRRRGIAVRATALSSILAQGAAEAAPGVIMQTIGKLALSSSGTAAKGGGVVAVTWLASFMNVKTAITALSLAAAVAAVTFIIDDEPTSAPGANQQADLPDAAELSADGDPAVPAVMAETDAAQEPTGELLITLRYRITEVNQVGGDTTPLSYGVNNDNAPLAPYAEVLLIPMRLKESVIREWTDALGLDENFAEYMRLSFTGGPEDTGTLAQAMGINIQDVQAALAAATEEKGEQWLKEIRQRLTSWAPRAGWRTVEAAEDGTALLSDLPLGPYQLFTRAASDTRPWPATLDESGKSRGQVDLFITAERREETRWVEDWVSRITGTVVDKATGKPLPNVRLLLHHAAAPNADQYLRSDNAGHFELNPRTGNGDFTIRYEPRRYEPSEKIYIPSQVSGKRVVGVPTHVVLKVEKIAMISGYVRNPDGSPAPDLSIVVANIGGNGGSAGTQTDAEGYYEISHDGGVVRFYVSGVMTRSEEAVIELAPEESVTHDFVLPPSAQIALNITTDDGLVPEGGYGVHLRALKMVGASRSVSNLDASLVRRGDQFLIAFVGPADYTLYLYPGFPI